MAFMHRTALWIVFMSLVHDSTLASRISCPQSVSARCHGTAEIHCNATSTIKRVYVSKNGFRICAIDVEKQWNKSTDARIWVEVPAMLPRDKSKVIVYIKNISLSDKAYELFVAAEGGHSDPANITVKITGFCVPQISVNQPKTEIVCRVNGKGQDGLLEWSDDNKETWGEKEAHKTLRVDRAEDNSATLTSTIKLDPSSKKNYCCRVSYNQKKENPTEAVCLHWPEGSSSLHSSADKPKRRQIFLLLALMPLAICILCFALFWWNGKAAVVPHRERTLSETPLIE